MNGVSVRTEPFAARLSRAWRRDRALWLLALPGMAAVIIFSYLPIYGLILAFKDYNPSLGYLGSEWVGFKHFARLFNDPFFVRTLRNTVVLGALTIVIAFPAPILYALMLNELRLPRFKRVCQTISYLPNFISVVIVVGFIIDFTSVSDGIINDVIAFFGGKRINFLAKSEWFRPIYIISGVWQGLGVGSILYLAAISGINPELYESAYLDGASRFQQTRYITLPCIKPTIAILFILECGSIMGNDFQKILLLYRPLTYETADVISTYVFRAGVRGGAFSYSTAAGFFTSAVSCLCVLLANYVSRRLGETSLL